MKSPVAAGGGTVAVAVAVVGMGWVGHSFGEGGEVFSSGVVVNELVKTHGFAGDETPPRRTVTAAPGGGKESAA
jgi:hypothetical protein